MALVCAFIFLFKKKKKKKKHTSRPEQAPGSRFHPHDESVKIDCGFLVPYWCNKNVGHERKVPCGSYDLLVSNIAEMKEK